ncbi:MAG: helix-turn-helix transcriptional regulator [Chlamydiae bacterium]|nr:helix-turn-helix transcriptional regulator [Chlamydiota bacterium]MBI3266864.1 helix-turn-helix transcriptional regulator [Chlamydiota bacterium]
MNGTDKFKKEIPELVRTHRKKSSLSQEALAKLAGVGKTAVFDLEHGKMTVQLNTLLRVFDALNIEVHFASPLLQAMKETQE